MIKISNKINIDGYIINIKKAKLSDKNFALNLVKNTIFQYVSKYFIPSEKMFTQRFEKDYKERNILFRGNRKIGMIKLSEGENHLNITGIFLTKTYQNRGIGKFLMEYFEDIAKSLGYNKIKLEVWDNNPARIFYKKIGYNKISEKNHKWIMQKEI